MNDYEKRSLWRAVAAWSDARLPDDVKAKAVVVERVVDEITLARSGSSLVCPQCDGLGRILRPRPKDMPPCVHETEVITRCVFCRREWPGDSESNRIIGMWREALEAMLTGTSDAVIASVCRVMLKRLEAGKP